MKKFLSALVSAGLVTAPVAASAADRDYAPDHGEWNGHLAGLILAAFVVAGVIVYLASRDDNHDHPTSP